MMKGKYMTTSEQLNQSDAENKANRETIQRLVNELNKCEKDAASTKVVIDTLKAVIYFYKKFQPSFFFFGFSLDLLFLRSVMQP